MDTPSISPHLSFSPGLWAVDEDETPFAKAGPAVGAVEFLVYKKYILNIYYPASQAAQLIIQ